jgi:hypothetical protein
VIVLIIRNYLKQPKQTHRKPSLEDGFVFHQSLERTVKLDENSIAQFHASLESVESDVKSPVAQAIERNDTMMSCHYELPDPSKVLPSPIQISALGIDQDSRESHGIAIPYRKSSFGTIIPIVMQPERTYSVLSRNASTAYPRDPKPSFIMSRLS